MSAHLNAAILLVLEHSDRPPTVPQADKGGGVGRRKSFFISTFSGTPLTDCATSDLCCVQGELENGSLHLQLHFFEN